MNNSSHNSTPADSVIEHVRQVLQCEAAAIQRTAERIQPTIETAIELLFDCTGRTILTGMGKMGYIARKTAATLCSTGTPALFLHPGEAAHGDLGMVTPNDVLLSLSYSGETDEIITLLPYMSRIKVPIIAMTGSLNSSLAKHATVIIDVSVESEADPIAVAPTSSSTVALAMCDAIAVALMHRRGFTKEQFAQLHPGGTLGRKLLLTVENVMHKGDEIPKVYPPETIREVIDVISRKRLGATTVVDDTNRLKGILTDGDLRRIFETTENPLTEPVSQHMICDPTSIGPGALAAEAIRLMEEKQITVLPVVDEDQQLVGVVHMHDLIRKGLS